MLDTVEAGFIDMKTVDGYIKQLNIPSNGQIDLGLFKDFMDKMDRVLVDDAGNLLGLDEDDLAAEMGGIDEEEIDEFLK